MLTIIKDINICYDGIRPINLKEGQDFDVKSVLPNPAKAKVFRNRLIGLKVAVEANAEKPKEPATQTESETPIVEADTFSQMSKEDLQNFLDDAAVKYHHKTGVEKLAELARGVAVQSDEDAE